MNKLQQDVNRNIQTVTTQLSNSIQDNNIKMMNLIESQQQLNQSLNNSNNNKSSQNVLPDYEYINKYITNEIEAKMPLSVKKIVMDVLSNSPEIQLKLFGNNNTLNDKISEIANELNEKTKQSIIEEIGKEIENKNSPNLNQMNELKLLIDKIINKHKEDIKSLSSQLNTMKQELLNFIETKLLEKSLNEKDKYVTQSSLNKILMEQKRSYNIFFHLLYI